MVTMFVVYNTNGDFIDDLAMLIVHNTLLQDPLLLGNHKGPKYPMLYILQCNEPYFSLSLQVKLWD